MLWQSKPDRLQSAGSAPTQLSVRKDPTEKLSQYRLRTVSEELQKGQGPSRLTEMIVYLIIAPALGPTIDS